VITEWLASSESNKIQQKDGHGKADEDEEGSGDDGEVAVYSEDPDGSDNKDVMVLLEISESSDNKKVRKTARKHKCCSIPESEDPLPR